MARHEHAHEVLGFLVGLGAGDDDFVDILAVEIADRALDQGAFLVNELWRGGFERQVAHGLPQPQQIFEVALDLGLGAPRSRRAQDHAHALGDFEVGRGLLEAGAVFRVGDLAADAAAAGGVGHQDRIAPGERQVGRQRRALGAAFLLDHLHQHDLAALDDLLDLVLAAVTRRAVWHFFHGVGAADGFDDFGFLVAAVFAAVVATVVAFGAGVGAVVALGVSMDAVALFVGVGSVGGGVRTIRCLGLA